MSLSTSLLLPIPPLSPSFLRHLPSNGHLVFCRTPGSASIHGGLFRVSSSFSSHGCAAFDGGSEGDLEDDDDDDDEVAENGVDSLVLPERWDVLGLGQAMVDFSGTVDDEFLRNLGLEKGTRKVVYHEERGRVLSAMDGCSYKAAAGGSLSNSLVALARLGSPSAEAPAINVAMAGSVGSDPLGGFYRQKLRRADVQFLSAPIKDGTTGTVIVLTTPDAQRTMLAYQGASSTVNYDTSLASAVSKTNILVVEGYLFELPDTMRAIMQACKKARSNGALVAITASDVSCIERHFDHFWEIVGNYADLIFANSDEARALCNFDAKESTASVTRYLSQFVPLVSVTDGPKGSYIGVNGEAVYIPPSPCVPVDTCGAGDAYASGILYGVSRGISDVRSIGTIASKVAATVVGQQGTRLRVSDAAKLAESFAFQLDDTIYKESFRLEILFQYNSDGRWVTGFCRRLGTSNTLLAELWAIRTAVEISVQRKCQRVVIESDSTDAIDCLTEQGLLVPPYSDMVRHIRREIPPQMVVRFEPIPREANSVADCLAQQAHVFGFGVQRLDFPLMECRHLLFQDAAEAFASLRVPVV